MPNYAELRLADGTSVRFVLSPGLSRSPAPDPAPSPEEDLPEGMGRSVPVARGDGRGAVAAFAVDTLRRTLQPLGTLLQEVHDAVTASDPPPAEVDVTFGIQVGHDLKLGIVGGNGQAHLTVSAKWQPQSRTE
ncbi:CU044_2847 family protein [Streptomyces abikoensis]